MTTFVLRAMLRPLGKEPAMAKSTSPRKTSHGADLPAAAKRSRPDAATSTLVQRLARARTANEITNVIGLRPIKGRSGPKIAY
jgi:hypothetical protein